MGRSVATESTYMLGCIDNRGKFQQQAVTHGLYDAASVLSDPIINQFCPVGVQSNQSAGLIHAHKA